MTNTTMALVLVLPAADYNVWTNNAVDATAWTVADAVLDYVAEVDAYAPNTARDHIVGVAQWWHDTNAWHAALMMWSGTLTGEAAAKVAPALQTLDQSLEAAEDGIREARAHWLAEEFYDGLFDAMSASMELANGITTVDSVLAEMFPPPPPDRGATPLPVTTKRTPALVLELLAD